ncbi:hypothetical protein A2442_02400 [Candidatus Campbellbacteria bacterium RIFOXYC2_FULL_35_25]|uniref:Uncharacterized protein n=1 Tax=Candidatus Campbellbacteria bacterium RIFOXYC2_FULL_35_25 TaxID=1797582 RepID=A0A1F5EK22_9BACT|nr:MAG: hypothetical protein A2442_02400 [Candidatus Campbellbacteria bacterium RIFOXYC2_FULL_35_25]
MKIETLLPYIKQELASGLAKDKITEGLVNIGGWAIADVKKAFSVIEGSEKTQEVSISEPVQEIRSESHSVEKNESASIEDPFRESISEPVQEVRSEPRLAENNEAVYAEDPFRESLSESAQEMKENQKPVIEAHQSTINNGYDSFDGFSNKALEASTPEPIQKVPEALAYEPAQESSIKPLPVENKKFFSTENPFEKLAAESSQVKTNDSQSTATNWASSGVGLVKESASSQRLPETAFPILSSKRDGTLEKQTRVKESPKSKIFVIFVVFLFSLFVLIGSTYAYFSFFEKLTLDEMVTKIMENLQIVPPQEEAEYVPPENYYDSQIDVVEIPEEGIPSGDIPEGGTEETPDILEEVVFVVPTDCGYDYSCFKEKFFQCEAGTKYASKNTQGVKKQDFEILSYEGGKCSVATSLFWATDVPPDALGKTMVCLIDNSKDFGKAYLDSIKSANCSGELYDVIKSLVP